MSTNDNYSTNTSTNTDGANTRVVRIVTARCSTKTMNPSIDPESVKQKVIEDINFLQDRIDHIKRTKMAENNPLILQTYESMLESRLAVLDWLGEQNNTPSTPHCPLPKSFQKLR